MEEEAWNRSVFIDLEPSGCTMEMTSPQSAEFNVPHSLSWTVRVKGRSDIRTPAEKSLNDAGWGLTLYEGEGGNEFTKQHNAVGQIDYFAERQSDYDDDFPESCLAWAHVDSATFAVLRDMAIAGKLPALFRLKTYGVNYGWEPDGSGKVWDVEARPHVPVSRVEIVANLVPPPDMKEESADNFWVDANRDSPEVAAAKATTQAIQVVQSRLVLIAFLLTIIAIAVTFR